MSRNRKLGILVALLGVAWMTQARLMADICSDHPEATYCVTYTNVTGDCSHADYDCITDCGGMDWHNYCDSNYSTMSGWCYCTAPSGGDCSPRDGACETFWDCCSGLSCTGGGWCDYQF